MNASGSTSDRSEASGPSDTAAIIDDLLPPQAHQLSVLKRGLYLGIAIVLIILGLVLWVMPLLTGVPFWMLGLVFLARISERCRRAVNWVDRKLPTRIRRALRWARSKFGIAQLPLEGPSHIKPAKVEGENDLALPKAEAPQPSRSPSSTIAQSS